MGRSRRSEIKERQSFRELVLKNRPICEAALSWCCAGPAREVNELQRGPGRVECWLRYDKVTSLCSPCHRWITLHPEWATNHGHQVPHEGDADFELASLLRAVMPAVTCAPECAMDHRESARKLLGAGT